MAKSNEQNDILGYLEEHPPKIIGGYKRQAWAAKVLDKISNDPLEVEEDGTLTATAILEAKDMTYYPAFLSIDTSKKGQVVGVYLIFEEQEQYNLIPLELAQDFIPGADKILTPFRYRTIGKIENDAYQMNWPDFS